jgi:hypothetical protein
LDEDQTLQIVVFDFGAAAEATSGVHEWLEGISSGATISGTNAGPMKAGHSASRLGAVMRVLVPTV